jgi:hypothetical protein
MLTPQALLWSALLLWLAGVAMAIRALQACRHPGQSSPSFGTALFLSLLSSAIGFSGWHWVRLAYKMTDNGTVRWNLDSRWFFLALLSLGLLAFVALISRRVLASAR